MLSILCLSGQFIPGGIQQVCSLLKPQITPKEVHIAPKPFFKLFVWQQLPSIFLPADYSDNSCVFVFLFFFFFLCVAREVIATSSTQTLFLCSSVCRWHGNNDKTATSVSHIKSWSLLLWTTGHNLGRFLETLQDLEGERPLFLCDPAHYKPFFPLKVSELTVYSLPCKP